MFKHCCRIFFDYTISHIDISYESNSRKNTARMLWTMISVALISVVMLIIGLPVHIVDWGKYFQALVLAVSIFGYMYSALGWYDKCLSSIMQSRELKRYRN